MTNPFDNPPISDEDRQRRLRALGLLARPVLDSPNQLQLREMIASPDWRPLPHQLGLSALAGLFRRHAAQAGVAPERLLEDVSGEGSRKFSSLTSQAVKSIRRSALVETALSALSERGVARMLLLKGEALAWLYPAPGLRLMGDTDLAILPEDRDKVVNGLQSVGFREVPGGRGADWVHPCGLMIDLHVPEDDLTRDVFERSVAHPKLGHIPGVFWPTPSDHLVIIAAHASRHGGTRVWRDICDVQALTGLPEGAQIASQALERAAQFGLAAQTAAIFHFMNRWAQPPVPLPEAPGRGLSQEEARLCRLTLSLYAEMAVESAPAVVFHYLRGFFDGDALWRRGANWLRRWWRSGAASTDPAALEAHQEATGNTAVGRIPPSDTFALRRMQLGLLWRLIRSGRFRFYRRILRMQVESERASPKTFRSPFRTLRPR